MEEENGEMSEDIETEDDMVSCDGQQWKVPGETDSFYDEFDGFNNESDGSDVDVSLEPGEIAARLKQNSTPDEDGFFECNPEDVELCPVEARERRYRLVRGITADSGAGDPVIPRRMINANKIRPSAGSRRGLHYVFATDHRIPNVGEVNLEFQTDEGINDSIVFQVADVNKPLMSISDRVDHRCRVVPHEKKVV